MAVSGLACCAMFFKVRARGIAQWSACAHVCAGVERTLQLLVEPERELPCLLCLQNKPAAWAALLGICSFTSHASKAADVKHVLQMFVLTMAALFTVGRTCSGGWHNGAQLQWWNGAGGWKA